MTTVEEAFNNSDVGRYYSPDYTPPASEVLPPVESGTIPQVSAPIPDVAPTPIPDPKSTALEFQTFLTELGLGDLMPLVERLVAAEASPNEVIAEVYASPEFAARYPAIAEIRAYNKQNPAAPKPVPSVAVYQDYERTVAQLLHRGGLSGLYSTELVKDLLVNELSPSEVSSRIQNAYVQVRVAAPEVRDAFSEVFGVDADHVLASYILDPDRMESEILQQIDVAKTIGRGRIAGIGVDTATAKLAVSAGVDQRRVGDAIANLSRTKALFRETITDTQDLEAGREGLQAQLQLDDGSAQDALVARSRARQAQFEGGGSALIGRSGTGI